MRLANVSGRSTIVTLEGLVDVATASNGAFSASTEKCVHQLAKLQQWFETFQPEPTDPTLPEELFGDPRLGAVISQPSQIFAIGLNYRHHADEMGLAHPSQPMVFTKFSSSLCAPNSNLVLPSDRTDWEAELVVIFAKSGRDISVEDALEYVGGYAVGQDYSERTLQMAGSPAQFSLGKSFQNFAPIGPWLTTPDDAGDPNDLAIGSTVNGETMQDSVTSDMVFSIAELISYISTVVEIRSGDIMFTGSPHGVGQGQNPPRFLRTGDVVETSIERLGTIRNKVVAK